MTVRGVAERLQVSPQTIYLLCARGKLGHVRVGTGRGTIRISEQHLEGFINEAAVQPSGPTAPPVNVKLTHLRL
jgi:excisionase family DNA binding protein